MIMELKDVLTPKQAKRFRFIRKSILVRHIVPTGEEIAEEFDVSSRSAYTCINVLIKKGYLTRLVKGSPRSIQLTRRGLSL